MNEEVAFIVSFKITHLPPALYAADALHKSGIPVVVVDCGDAKSDVFRFRHISINSRIRNLLPHKLRSIVSLSEFFLRCLFLFALRERPAVIVANDLPTQFMAMLLSAILRVPYVIHAHEIREKGSGSGLTRILYRFEGYTFRRCAFWVVPEINRKNILIERYGTRNTALLACNAPPYRLVADSKVWREHLNIPPSARVLVYVGGIGENVSLVEVVEAFNREDEVFLVIAGWGSEDYLRRIIFAAQRKGTADFIKLTGPVPASRKWDLIASGDIGLCLYKDSSLGTRYSATSSNKIFEYMSQRIGILVPARRGFTELIDETGAGCNVELSPESIRAKVLEMLSDQRILERYKNNARRAFEEKYNFDAQFEQALIEYRKLLASGRRR